MERLGSIRGASEWRMAAVELRRRSFSSGRLDSEQPVVDRNDHPVHIPSDMSDSAVRQRYSAPLVPRSGVHDHEFGVIDFEDGVAELDG